MAQTTTEVRSEIENKKEQINSKLEMLEERFETVADKVKFRHHVNQRPWAVVGVAAGLGFLLGRRRAHSVHARNSDSTYDSGTSRHSQPSFAGDMAKRMLPLFGSAVLKHVMTTREKNMASMDQHHSVQDHN